jgi:hypothetical protein
MHWFELKDYVCFDFYNQILSQNGHYVGHVAYAHGTPWEVVQLH